MNEISSECLTGKSYFYPFSMRILGILNVDKFVENFHFIWRGFPFSRADFQRTLLLIKQTIFTMIVLTNLKNFINRSMHKYLNNYNKKKYSSSLSRMFKITWWWCLLRLVEKLRRILLVYKDIVCQRIC